jgi:diguanylate cyclase (GGDEF)-like protein
MSLPFPTSSLRPTIAPAIALGRRVQERIQGLEALPIQPAVVWRLLELGRDPDADIREYVRLIESDPTLCARILSLVNSAWSGLSRKVSTVRMAVPLLGLKNVRTVALNSCLLGLHSTLKLSPADSRALWEASLCKAIAAKRMTERVRPARADEAFTSALVQDIGVGVFVSVGGPNFVKAQLRSDLPVPDQIAFERAAFGLDHAETGALLGEKLGLPAPFVQAIRHHHDEKRLIAALPDPEPARVLHAVALLPHDLRVWKSADLERLDGLLACNFRESWGDCHALLRDVQQEFEDLVKLLNPDAENIPSLPELVGRVCMETVRSTAALVQEVSTLEQRTQVLDRETETLARQRQEAEHRAAHDPLTGLQNRDGFLRRAAQALDESRSAGKAVAVAMFDLDRFKEINDTYGHACGDAVVQAVARRLSSAVRADELVGRWGGDEMIVLLSTLTQTEALMAVTRLQKAVQSGPVAWRNIRIQVTLTGGLRWVGAASEETSLEWLIDQADQALYQAKRAQRGTIAAL